MSDGTMVIYTDAPSVYDYEYMEDTGVRVEFLGATFRKLIVHDVYRFVNYQQPRYHSGFYASPTEEQFLNRNKDQYSL